MTVIGFKSKKDQNKDFIIEKLERCLALARQGGFKTFLTIGVLENNEVMCTVDGNGLEALGALRVAESRILGSTEDVEEA